MNKTQTNGHSNSKLAKAKLASAKPETIPTRLHHAAYVCRDLEQTRKFYEDILGWPMVAAWRECDKVFGEDELYYCHLFFQIADGGALAFFDFANPRQHVKFAHIRRRTKLRPSAPPARMKTCASGSPATAPPTTNGAPSTRPTRRTPERFIHLG
jgi:catechol 2,3-dioxygenase-like lactoylglutathione lyase family enzyme